MMMNAKKTLLPAAIIALACLAAAIFPANSFPAKAPGDGFCSGEIVVGLIPDADADAFNARNCTTIRDHIAGTDQYLLGLAPGVEVEDKLAEQILIRPRDVISDCRAIARQSEITSRGR